MKYLLSSYGLNNPYLSAPLADHAVYPIGTEIAGAIDLDYSTLLVGNGYRLDQSCVDYLDEHAQRLPFLQNMRDSISILREEGLLDTFDGAALIAENLDAIIHKTERLCEDWKGWLSVTRQQWRILKKDRDDFVKNYGSAERSLLNQYHNSAINSSFRKYGEFNEEFIISVCSLIESDRYRLKTAEVEIVKEVIRPLVCHTVIQDLFRFKTRCSVLDWDDSQGHYEKLYHARWDGKDEERKLAASSRNLFSFSIPQLKPKNIRNVVQFVRDDKAVLSLRKDIVSLLDEGVAFDSALGTRLVEETLRKDLGNQKKMKKVRWIGAIVGVFIPGGSIGTEAAVEGGLGAAEEGAEGLLSKKHRWLYSLIN
ncbi:MAG: hypothetical protein AAGI28_00910 [Pseudomonadota bacterium]